MLDDAPATTYDPDTAYIRAGPDVLDAGTSSAEQATPAAPLRKTGSFFAPLRVANFRRLLAGQTISRLGDQFYFVAIPWLVLHITRSPLALSLVLGASAVMLGLFTLIGGVLADRFGPRALMLGSDTARLLIMVALAALAVFVPVPPLWSLVALSALLGIATGLFYPASSAITPHLVDADDLQAANSFEQLTLQTSNFVGPGVAGALLGVTQLALGFVVDAASFVVSVVTLVFIRPPKRTVAQPHSSAESAPKPAAGLASLGEAVGYLRRTPFLLTILGLSLLGNFAMNGLVEVGLPLLLKQWVGIADGPRAMGIVIGGFGFGSILGAVAAGVAGRLRHKAIAAIFLLLPTLAFTVLTPIVGAVLPLAFDWALLGVFLAASNVLFITVIQRFIPLEMMGRMMSLVMLGSFVGGPLSIFAYGALATIVPGVDWLFWIGAGLLGIGLALALTKKVIWQTV
jgi:MFS family permease